MYKHFFKRFFDFWIALIALICISPILIVVTIWLGLPRPLRKEGRKIRNWFHGWGNRAFFLQERPGKDGKIFKIIKFKTMTDERDENGKLLPDAQRLTKVGRFLRTTSIDELSQLINVLKGDMALIGPRPLLVKYLPYYKTREQLRHTVRPGITGWAQVNGRNHVKWNDRLEYDVQYVENLTFLFDFHILWKTVMNVIQRKDIDVITCNNDLDYERANKNGDFMRIDNLTHEGLDIKVIRDDLFPDIGGGGKSRKAAEYERFMKEEGYNAVVTCGGIQSNHNRSIALMAARNGWKCHLCIQGTEERFYEESGNALIDRLSGAECELIQPDKTAEAMDRAMAKYKKDGYKPLYVHGGGHDLPGGVAFVNAVVEMYYLLKEERYKPDYIFHASGTGSTQAGILIGLDRVGWGDVKVVGISVARQYERGRKVIVDFANMLAAHYGMSNKYDDKVIFNTDYLCEGYEQYTEEMERYLKRTMIETGMVFDTTYSGKGFYGMMDYVKRYNLQNKNILFWHTGGIMNLMK